MSKMRNRRVSLNTRFLIQAFFNDPNTGLGGWFVLFGLAYGDIRSHQKSPGAAGKGVKELVSLHDGAPFNEDYYKHFRVSKEKMAQRRKELKKQILLRKRKARLRRMGIR